ADLGWLALPDEREAGSPARAFRNVAILMEEFGRGLLLEPFVSTAVLCAGLIDRAGPREAFDRMRDDIAAGRLRVALAHSEDGARWDLGEVRNTIAERHGTGYRISGSKILAMGGPSAHTLVVSARLAGDSSGRFALFLIDPGAPGVRMNHYRLIDYSRASDVRLNEVHVPAEAMLTDADHAHAALEAAVDLAILAATAEALGCMETVISLTAAHLRNREQFGKPLGSFQALQHRLADMFVEAQQARSILLQGIASLDEGGNATRAGVSAAKALAGRAGRFIGEQGVQLHGGIGVTEEAQVGHYYKKLVMYEKLFGDSHHHIERFSRYCG
ncbi:MAG: acyl-CoA dehydrogenase family protein, partial [Burkholderiales bacterium]|nr:acyl-CoA dehydrogenase family protein [Burkholderiales bacterium]